MKEITEKFKTHGTYSISNADGFEIMLNQDGDKAKIRDTSKNPKISEWLDIEFIINEDTDESNPVIDPNGYNIPLNMVMRIH